MTSLNRRSAVSQPKQPTSQEKRPRFARIRGWLRSRVGRIILPIVTLLLGVGIGVAAILLYALLIATEGRVLITPLPPPGADIVAQVGPTYITHLVDKDIRASGVPGDIENVRVKLVRGDQMTITGDDQLGALGIGVTRHFTIVVQPFVRSCQLQMHVLHADMGGIPVTGFVATFEDQVNQQLQVKPTGLPKGFVYCTTSVRTEPQGMFVTYSATPV